MTIMNYFWIFVGLINLAAIILGYINYMRKISKWSHFLWINLIVAILAIVWGGGFVRF